MYSVVIQQRLREMGRPDVNPFAVEGFIRERGALVTLTPRQFASQVRTAVACLDSASGSLAITNGIRA